MNSYYYYYCYYLFLVYRATFPQTFKELKDADKGMGLKVFAGTSLAIIVGIILAEFFKRTSKCITERERGLYRISTNNTY